VTEYKGGGDYVDLGYIMHDPTEDCFMLEIKKEGSIGMLNNSKTENLSGYRQLDRCLQHLLLGL